MSGRLRHLLPELPETMATFLVACAVELGLHTSRLPRLSRFLGAPMALDDEGPAISSPRRACLDHWAERRLDATRRILRHWPFGDTCLRQALIGGQRLRRLGPRLHVGVAMVDGELRAHAWLEVRGSIIDPLRAASDYLDLATPPGGRLS